MSILFHPLLMAFLRQKSRIGCVALIIDLAANTLALCLPLLLSQAYAVQFGFDSGRAKWLGFSQATFTQLVLLLGLGLVLKGGLDYTRRLMHGFLAEQFVADLRCRLFNHHLQMPLSHYEDRGAGRFLLRFSGDLGSVHQLVSKGVFQFGADVSLLVLGIVFIMALDARLGMLVGTLLSLFGYFVWRINHRIGQVETRRRNKKVALLAFVSDRLRHIAAIQALNRATREQNQFDRQVQRVLRLGMQYADLTARLDAVAGFGVYGLAAGVLVVSHLYAGSSRAFGADHVFAVSLLLITWRPVLLRVFQTGLVWKRGGVSLRNMQHLLGSTKVVHDPTAITLRQSALSTLHVDTLSFFTQHRVVLKTVSFTLHPGETGLIIGPAGSGKTALVKLLTGLYAPTTGSVRINGANASEWGSLAWRRHLAVVSNAFPLYGDTILDAIANSSKSANRIKAQQTLDAWAAELQLLQGLRASDSPTMCSHGQAQVLQCLRMVLANKPIWIMDEPFQSLDAETIQVLTGLLAQARKKSSCLMLGTSVNSVHTIEADWQLYVERDAPKNYAAVGN